MTCFCPPVPGAMTFTLTLSAAGPSSGASPPLCGRCWVPRLHHLLEGESPSRTSRCEQALGARPRGRGPACAPGFSGARRLGGALLEENSRCYPQRTLSCGSPRIRPREGITPTLSPARCHMLQDPTSVCLPRREEGDETSLSAKERSAGSAWRRTEGCGEGARAVLEVVILCQSGRKRNEEWRSAWSLFL